MKRSLFSGGALPVFSVCCLLLFSGAAHRLRADETKRVLIIHSFGSAAPPFTTHSIAFETELTEHLGGNLDLDEVSLDQARYTEPDMENALVEYLQKRQAKWQPDLVVPVGSPAGIFVEKFRDRLFQQATVLYTGMDRRRLGVDALKNNAAFVGEKFEGPGFVEDILQLAPETTNIVCIIGASPTERYWTAAFQSDFEQFTNRVSFTWLNDVPFDQMLQRVQKLPPHSFIFFILLIRDAAGITHDADKALSRIREVANAPVNGIFEQQLGLGIVGGRLYRAEFEGAESARLAVRILHGEAASNFPPEIVDPAGSQYDWRELRKWRISEVRLPSGSVVKYRQASFWQRYGYLIIAGLSVVLVQAVLIAGLAMNLNRRRKAERSLRESEQRFRTMADCAPVLIWMSGTDKTCAFVNRSWLEFTGRKLEQELGNGWAECLDLEHREQCLKIYHTAFDARMPFEMEYRLRRHDGEYRWMTDRGVPRYDANHEFLGYVGVAIDLTDRKSAEEARQRLAHTSRLTVVGELTAMIVHELNQPLVATRFNVESAKALLDPQSATSEGLLEILSDIHADNRRASEAIQRIRTLVSKHELQIQPVDINACVSEVVRMLRSELQHRSVQLHTDWQAPSAIVSGDAVHLQHVILNLIVNGMDAMKDCRQSERHLFVSTAANVDGYVEVSISDSGRGIEIENLSRIFESFYTTKPDGMGMGLFLARLIVQSHAGRLWAENNKNGKGTTLRFILPMEPIETSKPSLEEQSACATGAEA
jgi:PAS domain S-box-containing protein